MNASLYVCLKNADNSYINYPAFGLLEILEVGVTGSIIGAVFRIDTNGKLSAPVSARNAEFEYSPEIAAKGSLAVAEHVRLQNQPRNEEDYAHVVLNKATGERLHQCQSRRAAREFCSAHGLRIESTNCYTDRKFAEVKVYPTISTRSLALAHNVLEHETTSTDEQLHAMLEATGMTKSQAQDYAFKNRPRGLMAA